MVGALCFISIGALQISYFDENPKLSSSEEAGDSYRAVALANSVLAILNGFVWLADASYCLQQTYYD